MTRYWNDPEVLKKLGSAMGDSMEGFPGAMGPSGQMPPGWPAENGAAAGGEEAEAEEEEGDPTVHSAASTGVVVYTNYLYNLLI